MIQVRPEQPKDYGVIHDLIQSAFADKAYSSGTEGPIVRALRRDGDLTLSLVAIRSGKIVGHIAFSPVIIGEASEHIDALGPVAADPQMRAQGIGTALIREGLAQLKAKGASACVLVGDPNYYSRFGFVGDCGLSSGELPSSYVQALIWTGTLPKGEVIFAPGFSPESFEA